MRRFRDVRQEVRDHLEALGLDGGRDRARRRDQLVDRGDVDALRELLLVAQERRDVVPLLSRHEDHGLTVRLEEHAVGELRHQRGRDLVAGRLGSRRLLVNFFTSVGVVVGHVAVRAPQTVDGTPSRWSISIAAPPPLAAARRLKISPFWIWVWRVRMPCMSVSGPGGHPGT